MAKQILVKVIEEVPIFFFCQGPCVIKGSAAVSPKNPPQPMRQRREKASINQWLLKHLKPLMINGILMGF